MLKEKEEKKNSKRQPIDKLVFPPCNNIDTHMTLRDKELETPPTTIAIEKGAKTE